jgi:hypothetical protein
VRSSTSIQKPAVDVARVLGCGMVGCIGIADPAAEQEIVDLGGILRGGQRGPEDGFSLQGLMRSGGRSYSARGSDLTAAQAIVIR